MDKNLNLCNNLRTLLTYNIVSFTYLKKNGEIRKARGTRNLTIAEKVLGTEIPTPKTDRTNENAYFDLDKGAWRAYVPENLISIDKIESRQYGVVTERESKPKNEGREIPISRPTLPIDIELPPMFGNGTAEKIRKSMEELDKDIDIPIMPMGGGFGGGFPIGGGKRGELPSRTPHTEKVGVPIFTDKGIELPIGSITIEDFAKLVAKYVVAELADRLTNLN